MSTSPTSLRRALILFLAAGLLAAACGGDDDDDAAAGTEAGTDDAAASEADAGTGVDLTGVCPETIVLQTDWFPEAEYGAYFELIGPDGETDASTGTYTGPLLDTGVDLEIRSGGPYLGQQTVSSLMYQDDGIMLGLVHTDDAVRYSDELPTISVVAPLEHSPLALVWDADEYDFGSFEDVGASDATILVYTKDVNYVPFLVAKDLVSEDHFDDSFDGSYTRFVADNSLVQQAFVTETPYRLEHEIDEYGKAVDSLLVSESGYDPYLSSVSIRADRLEENSDCLEQLVPLIQQAQVDYMADPAEANQVMIDMVTELDTYWTLSEDLLAYGNEAMVEYEIVSNGDDETLGNFDDARVEQVVDDFQSTFGSDVDTAKPDVTVDDIVTNDFVDPSIGL